MYYIVKEKEKAVVTVPEIRYGKRLRDRNVTVVEIRKDVYRCRAFILFIK